jgi:hypothetical protein
MKMKGVSRHSPQLARDVFPDRSLPIVVDQNLLEKLVPAGSVTRSKSQSQNILLQHPADWSESNTADWLNRIGDTLIRIHHQKLGAYIDANRQPIVPSKKVWSCSHAGTPLKGTAFDRKPDMILVDEHFATSNTPTWHKVHALCEITRSERAKSKTIKDTITQKSYLMFISQDNRCFAPSLDICDGYFTFTVIDRSGMVVDVTSKITDDPLTLLRIIVGLMFGRPSVIGYDETIECDDEGRAINVMVDGKKYDVEEELFRSESFMGRATRCWRVSITEDDITKEFVVKDSWVDTRRTQNEIDILKYIESNGVREGVPKLVCGEDVLVCDGWDDTHTELHYIIDCTARRRVGSGEKRIHRRLLMGPVGTRITNFRTLKELVGSFIDVIKGIFLIFFANRE